MKFQRKCYISKAKLNHLGKVQVTRHVTAKGSDRSLGCECIIHAPYARRSLYKHASDIHVVCILCARAYPSLCVYVFTRKEADSLDSPFTIWSVTGRRSRGKGPKKGGDWGLLCLLITRRRHICIHVRASLRPAVLTFSLNVIVCNNLMPPVSLPPLRLANFSPKCLRSATLLTRCNAPQAAYSNPARTLLRLTLTITACLATVCYCYICKLQITSNCFL